MRSVHDSTIGFKYLKEKNTPETNVFHNQELKLVQLKFGHLMSMCPLFLLYLEQTLLVCVFEYILNALSRYQIVKHPNNETIDTEREREREKLTVIYTFSSFPF